MILACSKTFVKKRTPDNSIQNRMDFITKEMWRVNSPELNPLNYNVWENIWGLSQAPSKTEDVAKLMEMLQMTV